MRTFWLFVGPIVTGIWYYLLFVAAWVLWYLKFKKNYNIKKKQIKELSTLLDGYEEKSLNDMGVFENFKASMKESSFASLWKQYETSLIYLGPDTEGKFKIYSTDNADCYFNSETLSHGLMLGFWKNLAGIFTAIGILGTFLGLTAGLYGININSKDLEVLSSGIQNLFQGLSTAFLTSVVGIICAIIYNICYSRLMRDYNQMINEVASKLDSIFTHKNTEQILADSLIESKQQTEQMKLFSTQLVTAISESLDTSFQEQLVPVFDELRKSIDKLNSSGADALAGSIDEKTGKQLASFAATLDKLQQSMNLAFEKSAKQNEDNARQLNEAVKALTDASNTANRSILEHAGQAANTMGNALTGAAASISKTGNELSTVSSSMKKSLEETLSMVHDDMERHEAALKTMVESLQTTISRNNELINSAGDAASKFADASRPMAQVSEQIGQSLDKAIDVQQSISKELNRQAGTIQTASVANANAVKEVNDALKHIETSWKAYENNFKGVSDGLQKTFEILNKGINGYNDATNRALIKNLSAFDSSINTALSGIQDLNQDLAESVEDLNKFIKQKLR